MSCSYKEVSSDGYGTTWKTGCGHRIGISSPMEVGFSLTPLPNEDGKFCRYCGKLIIIQEKKIKFN